MSRTIATVRLYAAVLWLVVAVVFGGVRETLPDDEQTAGVWVAGFAWGLALSWAMLLLTTWLWWVQR